MDIKSVIMSQKGPARKRIVAACEEAGCRLHCIRNPDSSSADYKVAGLFHWVEEGDQFAALASESPERANTDGLCIHQHSMEKSLSAQDICLILRTSGTTSKPKKVPLTFTGLYTGAICMGRGMTLCREDVCLNVMPYSHIGGISCSLLATLFAGHGTVVCAPVFDASTFLAWLEQLKPTWYYAVPTIHKALCLCAKAMSSTPQHCLRLIRSGAAHLSHEDAKELRAIFNCQVLPTYSMTECMPITQPPLNYDLGKAGSVGVALASSMRIVGDDGEAVACGSIGEVCISGPVVTNGYIDNVSANDACFFGKAGSGQKRWFRTGDIGYLDKDGFLFLTGRNKEIIKRGGEQISPYEVEEAFLAHPGVEVAVAFGVPNFFWGEEVAVAVVVNADEFEGKDAASEFYQFLSTVLSDSKVPRQFVFLESTDMLPKTHTGKYLRAGLASHFDVQPVDLAAASRWMMPEVPKRRVVKPCKTIAIATLLAAFGLGLLLRLKSRRL